MPRKCCIGKCMSVYSGTDKKFTVFSFPLDNDDVTDGFQHYQI